MHVHQLLEALRVVPPRPPIRHPNLTPATQRLAHHEQVARPLAFVLVVYLGVPAGLSRFRLAHLAEELPARLVEAYYRAPRSIRQHIGLDHVLHVPDIFAVGVGWYAPAGSAHATNRVAKSRPAVRAVFRGSHCPSRP